MNTPATPVSRHLGPRQLRALEAIGDVLVPGDEDLPSFSRLGCVAHVDRRLDFMPDDDLRGLQGVLSAASFLPRFLVAGLLHWLEAGLWPPGPWAPPLRVVRLGLRGIVLSLYYSGGAGPSYDGPGPLDVLAYRVGVAVEDEGRPVLETAMER
jgi:hypothetical protein